MAANTSLAKSRTVGVYVQEAVVVVSERAKAIGSQIAAARNDKHWKQKQLAAAVHVEPVTVSRWERGQHVPSYETLELIAEATEKTLSFFLPEDDVKNAESGSDAEVIARLDRIEGMLEKLLAFYI
jgi:transcriptional regulator with XRE-family HTH domain